MATVAAVANVEQKPKDVISKKPLEDPLANHLIPETFLDRKKEADGAFGDIINKYNRGRVLGKGGFAKVFSAHQNNNVYAIKVVAKSSLVKPRSRQKFQTEIKIHRSLKHVNIVRFVSFFEDTCFAYIVMELCSNNSMSELMKRRKRLSEPESRFYLAQIVNSLQYLHSNLVIHRDLKLGNLFIDQNMRIKVGDFGLAARLQEEGERRKTICGTPNYIAPEILEGKNGHSFEVDVWSTGVILYTVLVGKPPFESKDVKSTYKRILQNVYSFPEGITVSSDAKSLIRQMLQPVPEDRPSLTKVLDHPFFSRPSNYTPRSLPEVALRECPEMPVVSDSEPYYHQQHHHVDYQQPYRPLGDENDPNLINRMQSQQRVESQHEKMPPAHNGVFPPQKHSSATATVLASAPSRQVDNFVSDAKENHPSVRRSSNGSNTISPPFSKLTIESEPPASTTAPSTRGSTGSSNKVLAPQVSSQRISSRTASGYGNMEPVLSSRGSNNDPLDRHHRVSSSAAPSASSTASNAAAPAFTSVPTKQKFDIFVDTKPTVAAAPVAQSSVSDRKQLMKEHRDATPTLSGHVKKPVNSVNAGVTAPVAIAEPQLLMNKIEEHASRNRYEIDIDQMQMDLELVKITPSQSASDKTVRTSIGSSSSSAVTSSMERYQSGLGSTKLDSGKTTVVEAWAWDSQADRFPATHSQQSVGVLEPKATQHVAPISGSVAGSKSTTQTSSKVTSSSANRTPSVTSRYSHRDVTSSSAANTVPSVSGVSSSGPALTSEPVNVMSTPMEQVRSSKDIVKQPLDTIETMHEMLNHSFSMVEHKMEGITDTAYEPTPANQLFAKVWVVGYVDYTSKYGLGFLFNTGSVGVYFNDSSKIILSAEGTVFQYIERRRRDAVSASDHVIQTHLITCYPMELQKKVTLLKHFKNYLLEQQKNMSKARDGEFGPDANTMKDSQCLIKDNVIAEGATSAIPFGESSAKYRNHTVSGASAEEEMPFLKKWVKTKHAILFRMSNRTVQVIFYDRSEILLSSEARVITYVSKQGVRTEQSLNEILECGRLDIAKRLKYTKDIMHRLINTPK